MSATPFALELQRYGPHMGTADAVAPATARQYCRHLAETHYENFTVASQLLPRDLRQHFCNVYAYCRWADDLADEVTNGDEGLRLLDWWESLLDAMYGGHAWHPVFVALAETVERFDIPRDPFADLLIAFRQDQTIKRYATWNDLLEYCRNSANPVGRLVLYLARRHREELLPFSDAVCTGLQLANFWQDLGRDLDIGRIYVPQEAMEAAGLSVDDFCTRQVTPEFRQMMAGLVARARALLNYGWPLVGEMPGSLRIAMALFIQGGLAILEAIQAQDYDVWRHRPTISRNQQLRLLFRAIAAACFPGRFARPRNAVAEP